MINPDYFQHYEYTYIITDVDTGKIIHKDIIVAPRLIHE